MWLDNNLNYFSFKLHCGEIGTLVHCWWQCKIVHPLWKIVWWFFKVKNRTTIWSSNPTSGYTTKRTENRVSKRYLYTHVHSSIIHNSQRVEATQVSINKWINNVLYTCNGILLSLKKERNSDKCYNMDEPWGHYAKWNKPATKRQILFDSTYMKDWQQSKLQTESRMVAVRGRGRRD